MNQREANRIAHTMIRARIDGLLACEDREDLPQADIERIDAALAKWTSYHFDRSSAVKSKAWEPSP